MTTSRRRTPSLAYATAVAGVLVCAVVGCGNGAPRAETGATIALPTAGPTADAATAPPVSSRPAPTRTRPTPPSPTTSPAGSSGPHDGEDLERLPTTRKVVALTFDAGANADGVPSILATLARERVPATFFLTGDWVGTYPAEARQIGLHFPVGNHSMTHPALTGLAPEAVRAEVVGGGNAISAAIGRPVSPVFRFPLGDRDDATIATVNDLGYVAARWTVDTLGWKGTSGGMTEDLVLQRVEKALTPGAIVLMHVGSVPEDRTTLDASTLPRMIDRLRTLGYDFVTLESLTT